MPVRFTRDARGLAPRQAEAVAVVAAFVWRDGVGPTVEDVARVMGGIAMSTAAEHLRVAAKLGAIEAIEGRRTARYTLPAKERPGAVVYNLLRGLAGINVLTGAVPSVPVTLADWNNSLGHRDSPPIGDVIDFADRFADSTERAANRDRESTLAALRRQKGRKRG